MRFLTALTAELEVGYQHPDVALERCISDTSGFRSLLKEDHALLVLACFEEGDTFDEVKEAAAHIADLFLNLRADAKTIVLVPFAHLTPHAMHDTNQVAFLLDKLQRALTHKGHDVRWLPPESANLCFSRWLFFDKMRSVRFGSSSSRIKGTLRSLLRAHGSRKILAILGDLLELK